MSKNLTKIVQENVKLTDALKDNLNKLADEVELSKKKDPDEPETMLKVNNLKALQKQLMDVMSEQQIAQTEFKANLKGKIVRQIDFIDEDLSKNEKDALINDPEVIIIK